MERVLIANRGEIACRIIRSLSNEGIHSIAIFSDADKDAPHVLLADEAVRVGPPAVGASYLNIDAILEAARKSDAQAIHPGYGFLSENAGFAERVKEAGFCWIGPPPKAISAMGDKARAKAFLKESNVPMAAGFMGDQSDEALLRAAGEIGYPLLIKATAGGGGRGIRLVEKTEDFMSALRSARSEAKNAFGDDTMMLEQFITGARHVEVQVMADQHGHAVHFFERDCSAQRRRQKIIEEAPCPLLTDLQRAEIGAAAVRAALSIGYEGAGTVEFLLSEDGQFTFLEMNTRLQVEHPVTEMITGHDLVAWQIRVAMGEHLPQQSAISFDGHAIEARIYAESPHNNFLPQTGQILLWKPSEGEGRRIDSGIQTNQIIGSHYDPMLAKIICWGPNRERAIQRLKHCIGHSVLIGVPNNRAYLLELLGSSEFETSRFDIGWVDTRPASTPIPKEIDWVVAALLLNPPREIWNSRGHCQWTCHISDGETDRLVRFSHDNVLRAEMTSGSVEIEVFSKKQNEIILSIDGLAKTWQHAKNEETSILVEEIGSAVAFSFQKFNPTAAAAEAAKQSQLIAPMTGRVVAVHAELGQAVSRGDTLMMLEAMKMEHPIRAGMDGIIETLFVSVGEQCSAKQVLGTVKPVPEE